MSTILPLSRLVERATAAAPEDRLGIVLAEAGCEFHDKERRLVKGPSVTLATLGGMPAERLDDVREAADAMLKGIGFSAFMSYLALPGDGLETSAEKVAVEKGHGSILHAAHVGLFVAGVSCAVENEFNSQRDLVHLSRITAARTAVQSRPPVVVAEPDMVDSYRWLLQVADHQRGKLHPDDRDGLEAGNLLYPASKATAFLMSGTLRSFQKLVSAIDDQGKEAEYRKALGLVAECLRWAWPTLFAR